MVGVLCLVLPGGRVPSVSVKSSCTRIESAPDARIPFVGVKSGDLDNLQITLADDETFEAAGLVRADVLLGLSFALVGEAEAAYVHVQTRDYLKEPALNFIVEVSWSGGRILREYTLILQ